MIMRSICSCSGFSRSIRYTVDTALRLVNSTVSKDHCSRPRTNCRYLALISPSSIQYLRCLSVIFLRPATLSDSICSLKDLRPRSEGRRLLMKRSARASIASSASRRPFLEVIETRDSRVSSCSSGAEDTVNAIAATLSERVPERITFRIHCASASSLRLTEFSRLCFSMRASALALSFAMASNFSLFSLERTEGAISSIAAASSFSSSLSSFAASSYQSDTSSGGISSSSSPDASSYSPSPESFSSSSSESSSLSF
mmetsp:Transcript_8972/g.17691  ORF Transcript_8972/g.17691 Transcript_8972/m.17691 type:complete len:257 (-) Transcript_8972:88-858(-)